MADDKPVSIVWLRSDLRLEDNPALTTASSRGGVVVPLYIWCPEEEGDWSPGSASRWWLLHSLEQLKSELLKRGATLIMRPGPALNALKTVIKETGAEALFFNHRYEPGLIQRDNTVIAELKRLGVTKSKTGATHYNTRHPGGINLEPGKERN